MPDSRGHPLPPLGGPAAAAAALSTLRRKGDGPVPVTVRRYDAGTLDARHVADYAAALGFDQEHGVPLTYAYLLAQRAQLGLMLDPAFPFPVVGVVHAANLLRRTRPLALDAPIEVTARIAEDATSASGGRYLTLEAVLAQDGREATLCRSRYLVRRGRGGGAKPDAPGGPTGEVIGRYRLEGDAGRRYARLSGDRNPIHLWGWSARLFGFRHPIIHGMHTVARVAALAEARLGRPLSAIDASFRKPIALPADVAAWLDGARFAVGASDVLAVVGTVEGMTLSPAA